MSYNFTAKLLPVYQNDKKKRQKHTHRVRDKVYREYVYSAVVYQKYLTRLRELIIFEPWRENYHFSQPS